MKTWLLFSLPSFLDLILQLFVGCLSLLCSYMVAVRWQTAFTFTKIFCFMCGWGGRLGPRRESEARLEAGALSQLLYWHTSRMPGLLRMAA